MLRRRNVLLFIIVQIRSDFRKWFPRMCQYGFVEGRDYEFVPRVRPQDEGGRTVQRYVKDYRITLEMAKQLYKLHHFHKNDCFRSCEGQHCMETDHWMQAIIELLHQHTVLEDFYAVGALADELTHGFHMEERGYIDRTEVNSRLIAFARELERILDKWETHATLIA